MFFHLHVWSSLRSSSLNVFEDRSSQFKIIPGENYVKIVLLY